MSAIHTTVYAKTTSAHFIHASRRLTAASAILLSLSACANLQRPERRVHFKRPERQCHQRRLAFAVDHPDAGTSAPYL